MQSIAQEREDLLDRLAKAFEAGYVMKPGAYLTDATFLTTHCGDELTLFYKVSQVVPLEIKSIHPEKNMFVGKEVFVDHSQSFYLDLENDLIKLAILMDDLGIL